MSALTLILGDQLTPDLSSLSDFNPSTDTVLMAEVMEEATYVGHHKKKLAFVFSAMRHFAEELEATGVAVRYVKLTDPENEGSLRGEVARALDADPGIDTLIITKPGEWRLLSDMEVWANIFDVEVELRDDTRFIATLSEFSTWAAHRKQLRMEYFYREMRQKTGLLMEGDSPAGGKWNYDQDNRKRLPKSAVTPQRWFCQPDQVTQDVLDMIAHRFPDNFGDLEPFVFGVTRHDAEAARDAFMAEILPGFGDYQDAMAKDEPWMWHSILSIYLNVGLLDPLDLCERAEAEWKSGRAPLNAVEGFIRQILGWREYVRGLYWWNGPKYAKSNFLNAQNALPDFYWTGETDMACLADALGQTIRHAYAHHIQRLMITGNFALLAGIHPDHVNDWYMSVYADAYEWVELPNTHGMALFADGGVIASKPYAASANYINKMSDYCAGCRYSSKTRTDEDSCPFNTLYWDFLIRHSQRLHGNPRMSLLMKNAIKMPDRERDLIQRRARTVLKSLNIYPTKD